jgi:TonB-linked SusC/RagA family outer membrane protein
MPKTNRMYQRNQYRYCRQRSGILRSGLLAVICLFFCLQLTAQSTASVKGLVENQQGEPLQGVTVLLQVGNPAKESSTFTDSAGVFIFPGIPSGQPVIIRISFVGYESQVIRRTSLSAGKEEAIIVSLVPNQASMQGVVVVGYGTQKRKDVTGAVSSVSQDRLEKVPNLNIGQVLQGSIAGVMVQQTGAGAASSEELMVRGRKSILANNSPLIVVDGIPYGGQLRDINVNDVQSIDVLKDASAAAIYGSRGANGVVLITTKTGAKGKPVVSYDGRLSTQKAINVPYFMSAEEFYAFKNIREPGKITASEQKVYDAGLTENWADHVLQTGIAQQHVVSVSGGFQQTKYFIGGSYFDVKGVTLNDKYRRFTTRINLDTRVTSWLTLGTRTQLSFDDRSGMSPDWEDVLRTNPLTRAYNDAGEFNIYPWPEYTDIGNPLEQVRYINSDKTNQVITNNYALVEAPFLKGLSYRINTGVRKTTSDIDTYRGRNTRTGLEARGVANTERTLHDNLVIENLLSYEQKFGIHQIGFTGLYSYEKNIGSSNIVDGRGFPNDFLTYFAMAQANQVTPLYLYNRTDLISQMARLNYSYDSRYLITITGRRDGYSGFGANNKWGLFPSVAIGWNISDERFFPLRNVFDRLKLRASLGRNGNQAVTAYETISRLAELNMVSLDQSLPGYVPSKLGQDNLGWESTASANIGLDFSIAKGRITGDLNFYQTRTSDLLLNRTISLVHGIGSITQNIGKTENKGFELTLHSENVVKKDFKWSTSVNFSMNKNKIVSLYGVKGADGKEIDDVANSWFIGKPILVNYGYVFDGVWQLSEADAAAVWGSQPGNAKLKDVTGDKVLTAEDRETQGQLDPKWLWGITNTFSYKGFNLQVFLHGVHGITRQNSLLQDASASSEVRRNVLKKNWWTPENPTNEFYRNAVNAERMSGIAAVIYEDASFIRIKDISLSYDFGGRILTNAGLSRLRLYATARNLFTITKWTASDPELNVGRGALPLQRELLLGVNISL